VTVTTTIPNFVIKVLLHGRKEPIASMSFDTREAAEADLLVINQAYDATGRIELPWLMMSGTDIQAAYIEDHSSSFGFV
jgi:hypothetical protein